MRTTLKRGLGRSAAADANGRAVLLPAASSAVTRYVQPEPVPSRSGLRLLGRILVGSLFVITSLAVGVAGGSYLYFHQSVSDVLAHTPQVINAEKSLDVVPANAPAIALIIGYDQRKGAEFSDTSRSDTIMLVRADPRTKTISMLSFPRDLDVPIYCGSVSSGVDRINSAYARCNAKGTLLTVKHLTGLPVNYLITVNFHGFKEVVDNLARHRSPLLQQEHRRRVRRLREHQSAARLSPPHRAAGAGLRSVPSHRRRPTSGFEETDFGGAPILADKSFRHDLGGREFDLYYNGSHLHMVVLHAHGATYWVVNTLLDSLSNETMLAIAKGLRPLSAAH
jgi:hypothetical protein